MEEIQESMSKYPKIPEVNFDSLPKTFILTLLSITLTLKH